MALAMTDLANDGEVNLHATRNVFTVIVIVRPQANITVVSYHGQSSWPVIMKIKK